VNSEPLWTEEQVAILVRRQAGDSGMHPYTCSGGGGPCSGVSLVPTVNGWACEGCGFTQTYVHSYDLDGTWPGKWPLP
jgi:hypothetical protein